MLVPSLSSNRVITLKLKGKLERLLWAVPDNQPEKPQDADALYIEGFDGCRLSLAHHASLFAEVGRKAFPIGRTLPPDT